jgi:hypothetical protein
VLGSRRTERPRRTPTRTTRRLRQIGMATPVKGPGAQTLVPLAAVEAGWGDVTPAGRPRSIAHKASPFTRSLFEHSTGRSRPERQVRAFWRLASVAEDHGDVTKSSPQHRCRTAARRSGRRPPAVAAPVRSVVPVGAGCADRPASQLAGGGRRLAPRLVLNGLHIAPERGQIVTVLRDGTTWALT